MPPDPRGVQVVGSGWLQRTSRPGLPGRGRAWRPIVADRHDIDQRPGSVINAGRAPLGTAPEAGDATWARARVSWLHCRSYSYSLYCCRTTPSEEKQTGLRGGNMRALVTATVRLLRASAGGGRSRPLLSLLPNFSSELTLGVAVVICRTRYRTMYRAKAKNPKKGLDVARHTGSGSPPLLSRPRFSPPTLGSSISPRCPWGPDSRQVSKAALSRSCLPILRGSLTNSWSSKSV